MGFLDSIERGLRLIKLDGSAAIVLAKDKSALVYGWIIIIIAVLSNELGNYFKSPLTEFSFFNLVISIIIGPVLILIYHGLAKLFGGQSRLPDFFRAQSHVFLLSWLMIFTFINVLYAGMIIEWVIGLWSIVITVIVVKAIHQINTWKSIIVALALPLILIILLAIGNLAYFGVLSPEKFLPTSCIIGLGFFCEEFNVYSDGNLQLTIRNNLGQDVNSAILFLIQNNVACEPQNVNIKNLESSTFTCKVLPGKVGEKYVQDFKLTYTASDTTIPRDNQGRAQSKYR